MSKEYDARAALRRVLGAGIAVFLSFVIGTFGYYFLGIARGYPASLLDCFYMTLITLTTIGYGEVLPFSHLWEARLFTSFIIIFGIGTFLYLISALTSFVLDGDLRRYLRRKYMDQQIGKMSDHIIVCGAGQMGIYVCQELARTGHAFVVIDKNEQRLQRIEEFVGQPISDLEGDATEDEVLREAGIERARGLISALSEDKDNMFCVLTARTLNPKLQIVTRAVDRKSAEKLERAGANRVVSTHYIGGMRMVSEMIRPQVVNFLDIMMQGREQVIRVEEVHIGAGCAWVGKSLDTLLQQFSDVIVISVYQPQSSVYQHKPRGDVRLAPEMVLVVIAPVESIWQLRESAKAAL